MEVLIKIQIKAIVLFNSIVPGSVALRTIVWLCKMFPWRKLAEGRAAVLSGVFNFSVNLNLSQSKKLKKVEHPVASTIDKHLCMIIYHRISKLEERL